jgi:tight adherence protein B
MLLVLAALCVGGFTFTGMLWVTGFGSAGSAAAAARLDRLKDGGAAAGPQEVATKGGLRRRSNVNFGGINVISGNVAAKWATDLERAGLTLNTKEYLVVRLVVGMLLAAVAYMFLPIPILSLAGLPLGFFIVGFWLKRRITTRLHKMESQMVEMLQMISSGLRAGFGLVQALEASGEQLPAPLSLEIRRTLRDTAMGASIDQALGSLNDRIGSSDFDIVITAILIQRTVGGNLAEILDNVAHTMRERERIRGEIRTLTSQQRLTGYVIGGIPIGLGIIFSLISPAFISLLFTDPLGRMMLGGAIVLEIIGFFVISRIVNIEV